MNKSAWNPHKKKWAFNYTNTDEEVEMFNSRIKCLDCNGWGWLVNRLSSETSSETCCGCAGVGIPAIPESEV